MAEEVSATDASEAAPKKKKSLKKLLLFVGAPILLLAGVGGGLYASGALASLTGGSKPAAAAAATGHAEVAFYDLPDMLVNLNTGGRKTSFLKMTISLELDSATDQPKIQAVQPRVIDTFQTYLRELRPEDLRGSAGIYRLREALLMRVNTAVAPAKVDDVLFREMLVQ